jgi:capsular polysaccharide export protein
MNSDVWNRFTGKRVLLLQGPVGPFFASVALALRKAGAKSVNKINFNGGDCLFYPREATSFRGTLAEWPGFLDAYRRERGIEAFVLFGDCRPIHKAALKLAADHGIAVWVFEEGYVRPNYVTLERQGVNGFSTVPTASAFYRALPEAPAAVEQDVGSSFFEAAKWAMLYFAAGTLATPWFRHRVHHRSLNMLVEGATWCRSYGRKLYYRSTERDVLPRLTGPGSKKYFLVPLQVARDSQVLTHSGFASVDAFLRYVVASFAEHAPRDTLLVIKHHPMDRGYHDYADVLRQLEAQHALAGRVVYVHDLHLPTLLSHARGVVVINSTVGLSALHHCTPVITLGKSVYNIEGLTFQGTLASFWKRCHRHIPDLELYWKFRNYLVEHTQLNGSFYKHLPGGDATGLVVGPSPDGLDSLPSHPTESQLSQLS